MPISTRQKPYAPWIALLLAACLSLEVGCGRNEAAVPPSPPAVQVTQVAQRDVPIYAEWVASLDGYINAQIQPQVSGYLLKQDYKEGANVRKGQVLFEIDARPFEAALQQAQGQLAGAEAQLSKTSLDVTRDGPLAQQKAIPQAQLDNDIQAKAAAAANVTAAQAQVTQAELNLNFTKVRSLVDGVAGLAKVEIGDLVTPTTPLTTVSQIKPIKAYFSISEQEYMKAAAAIKAFYNGKRLEAARPVQLLLADGSTHASKGRLIVADREVDPKTGTIRMAAEIPNPDGVLRPGQFARVRIQTQVAKNALLVPQRAVTETQGSYQVITVAEDNKAAIRPVAVGERVGDMWIITAGLEPGDRVIVEGIQKVKEGTVVNPTAAPAAIAQGN